MVFLPQSYMQSEGVWLYCLPAIDTASESPYLFPEPDVSTDPKSRRGGG